jgi:hypothetical protein
VKESEKVTRVREFKRQRKGATSRDSVSCCRKKIKGCWKKGRPKRSRALQGMADA